MKPSENTDKVVVTDTLFNPHSPPRFHPIQHSDQRSTADSGANLVCPKPLPTQPRRLHHLIAFPDPIVGCAYSRMELEYLAFYHYSSHGLGRKSKN